jgi:hypothetical protein
MRYCLAASLGQHDLASRCCHSAMMDYIKYPDEYDSAFEKHIPKDFRDNARQLKAKLLRGH